MCLLAIAWKVHPRWAVVMAGNRDEAHERPAAPLARWERPAGILAGRDLRSGGTWAGLSTRGRMAVVTNVRDPRLTLPQAPSRGGLPVECLTAEADGAATAGPILARASGFAPFNLLIADPDQAWFLSNYPHPRQRVMEPGVHGLSNGDLDEPWPKTRELMSVMSDWIDADEEDLDRLWLALANERTAPDAELPDTGVGLERERLLSAAFIRNPVYGTRASTIIAIDHEGAGWISERRFDASGALVGESTLSTRA